MKANNMYDKTKVTRSDKGAGKHNQQEEKVKVNSIKTSHNAVDKNGVACKPYPNQDHKGFQFGTNPEKESGFEKRLVMKEKKERDLARIKYIQGIQGTDGGKKPYEDGYE